MTAPDQIDPATVARVAGELSDDQRGLMPGMTTLHNGMTTSEQSPIPLHRYRILAVIETSEPFAADRAAARTIGDAIWRAIPGNPEDGDVFVRFLP